MSVYAGPADWWTDGTDAGRTHIATKGIVQQDLLLNYDAGASISYPGSGTTWSDISGGTKHFTLTTQSFVNENGGGISFPANSVLSLTSTRTNFDNGGFTMSVWIKHTGPVSTGRIQRYFTVGSSPGEGPVIRHTGSSGGIQAYIFDSGSTLRLRTVTSQVVQDEIANFTFTYDGTNFVMYKNGNIILSTVLIFTLPTTNGNLNLSSASEWFDGNMYCVHYYNRGLSAAEIQQNFNALRGRFGI
jgi:hypothetical protein